MSSKTVKIVCISDTHGLTDQENFPPVPDGDILLHAGDISQQGNVDHIAQFNAWLGSLPHQYKIVIAGNHDKMLDPNLNETAREMKGLLTNCIYLEDDAVNIKGIKFYGTPFSKKRAQSTNHAFQMSSEELKSRWAKIPDDIDILMTHTPPYGIHDVGNYSPEPQGCKYLLQEVTQRIKPKFHVFGHIHSGYGSQEIGGTAFINAAMAIAGNSFNPPTVFTVQF